MHSFGRLNIFGVWPKLVSMPQGDHASGETLLQRYPLRWIVFALMWFFGMMTIVMGLATQEASWDWKYHS